MKFQPLASKTYNLIFEYNEPRYQEACEKMITKAGVQKLAKFSENWSYGVFVDGGTDMVYWNIYDSQVKATIDQMGLLKGIPIQVIVGREMGEKNKPYDTFQFIKDNVSYYSQQTQAPAQDKPQPEKEQPPPRATLEDVDNLMWECWLLAIDHFSDTIPYEYKLKYAITVFIECNKKGIKAEPKAKDEISKDVTEQENYPSPEAQDIHGQPPPHSDDEAPF